MPDSDYHKFMATANVTTRGAKNWTESIKLPTLRTLKLVVRLNRSFHLERFEDGINIRCYSNSAEVEARENQ